MATELDWIKLAGLALGLLGSALGIYNLWISLHVRRQEFKKGYAITLLWLDPIIQNILTLPLSSPNELAAADHMNLAIKLEELENLLDQSKEKLVSIVPEIASRVLNLQRTSKALREQLTLEKQTGVNCIQQASEYLFAAYELGLIRVYSSDHGMKLNDQRNATQEDWYGDDSVHQLSVRWKNFTYTK